MSVVKNPTQAKIRQLFCKITLQSGEFTAGNNTLVTNMSTINANVHKALSNDFINAADISIFGLNNSDIAAISTLGFKPLVYQPNKIELYAQYEDELQGTLPSLCFSGFIIKAYADFSDMNRPLRLECTQTYQNSIQSAQATNTQGIVNIPEMFKNIATSLGHSFQNNGVTGVMENPILTGSYIDQLRTLGDQTNTNCVIDNGILKISPFGYSLNKEILDINAGSGMLGYPKIDNWGIQLRIRYNPSLQLGQYIKVETDVPIPKSTGQWFVYDMNSSLNNNHEDWYTDLKCSYNNLDFS